MPRTTLNKYALIIGHLCANIVLNCSDRTKLNLSGGGGARESPVNRIAFSHRITENEAT